MAAEKIAVRPARKDMALAHPVDGPLRDEGGEWPADGFTFRRLRDKDIVRVEPAPETEAETKNHPRRGPSSSAGTVGEEH